MRDQSNVPTILTVYGATGDLVRKKVIPSLYFLFEQNELPTTFRVIGFSRRDLNDETYRDFIVDVLTTHLKKAPPKSKIKPFLKLFLFQRGDFDESASYEALKKRSSELDHAWGMCSNKLFYLSVAPEFYKTIFTNLSKWKLMEPCAPGEGWTRVMVEKPFGVDSATAKRLDLLLAKYFQEEQIYRIDHYLAKEMLQNILDVSLCEQSV
jgi:glucose-6-phosphate 1-dehydrogenase